MARIGLPELFANIAGTPLGSWEKVLIANIRLDSRRVEPGDLFVVMEGQHTNGIHFIQAAVDRGAVALLLPQAALPALTRLQVPGLAVSDPRAVLPKLAARLERHPARDLRLTGVTGTNGKTTVVYMISHILEKASRRHAFWSTASVHSGADPVRPQMTTPEAPDLHRFLSEARASGVSDALLEVSSHGIVLNRIGGLNFAVGTVTNLSPDHLDFHRTYEAYQAAKRSFIAGLDPSSTAVLNADDPIVSQFAASTRAKVWHYGIHHPADFSAKAVHMTAKGIAFTLTVPHQIAGDLAILPAFLPTPGVHNLYNALAAIASACALGIDPALSTAALQDFDPPVRRLEAQTVGPYTVINDVAMNCGSYEAVMKTMAALGRPLVIVNALRGNRGTEVNRDIAASLARWNHTLEFAPLIVSESHRQVAQLAVDYSVRHAEREAFLAEARRLALPVEIYRELEEAIAEGINRLKPNGILLLLGTFGMDEGARLAVERLHQKLGTKPDV